MAAPRVAPHRPPQRWLFTWLMTLTLWLAAAVRFYRLGFQSFWSDEGNSFSLAQAGFLEIARRTAFDIHPPLYYWLLKIWLVCFGQTEFAARSLSAMLSLLLVAVTYALGRRIGDRWLGVIAAFVAAWSPFQIYYAQEARMYMLLALLAAGTVLLALSIWQGGERTTWRGYSAYALPASLGLYTQYAFPLILVIINLTALYHLRHNRSRLWVWLGWQLVPLLLYLPWLPIAFRQITTWPTHLETATSTEIGLTLVALMSLGPSAAGAAQGWLGAYIGLALIGLVFGLRHRQPTWVGLTALWLLLPAGITAFFFRAAYLKIFLIAGPAFCLLVGLGLLAIRHLPGSNGLPKWRLPSAIVAGLVLLLIAWPGYQSLAAYYTDPTFHRDNYRAVAAYLSAIATPDDAIIIHAPGQQEVFGYYYPAGEDQAPPYPLPRQRPLDAEATVAELATLASTTHRIYGLFWATEEADPDNVIETWLNRHTFKAADTWFGNIRLVSYATFDQTRPLETVDIQFGPDIHLTGVGVSEQVVAPGDILQVSLRWQTDKPLTANYTVFLQLLAEGNHLVGQRDALPSVSSLDWPPGETVADHHGVPVAPGTPPRPVRLIAGLYDAATGIRLPLLSGADFVELGTIRIAKNRTPLPLGAFQMAHRLGDPPLLGYDLHKRGFSWQPDAPLHPGDLLHLNLYWQKMPNYQADTLTIQVVDEGGSEVTGWQGPIAGIDYPLEAWAMAEIVRAQFDLSLGDASPGAHTIRLQIDGRSLVEFGPFRVIARP